MANSTKAVLHVANGYLADFDQFARLLHTVCLAQMTPITSDMVGASGVTDKKAKYIISLAVAFDLILPTTLALSAFGRVVEEHDNFLDDVGTLWMMHYIVSSNPRNLVWNRLVNSIFPSTERFDVPQLLMKFPDLEGQYAQKSLRGHLQKEINTVLDAYINQHLSRLAYLRCENEIYRFGYREPVPIPILAASITRFRDQHQTGNTAVSVRDLISAPNSPGVVFQMHEDTLRAGLEQLRHGYGFSLEARADLDQLRFAQDIPEHVRMEHYYASR